MPHHSIQLIMPKLLRHINKSSILKSKLFQINFRSLRTNILATMIYHKELLDEWIVEAKVIQAKYKIFPSLEEAKIKKLLIIKKI